jgi:hypothetical protein
MMVKTSRVFFINAKSKTSGTENKPTLRQDYEHDPFVARVAAFMVSVADRPAKLTVRGTKD